MWQYKPTDLEPGGNGTSGPWPPSRVSVVNPSQRMKAVADGDDEIIITVRAVSY